MSAQFIIQVFLPAVVPVAAGYLLARFTGLTAGSLRGVSRYVVFPALLFVVMVSPIAQRTGFLALVAGAAMVGLGIGVVTLGRQFLGMAISPIVGLPAVAVFAIPFLKLSWDGNALAMRVSIWMFVGVAVAVVISRGRSALQGLVGEPWAYAAGVAIILQVIDVSIPFIIKPLAPLASAAYPLLLVFLGTLLHPFSISFDRRVLITVGVRLATGLVVVLLVHSIFRLPRMALEAAMIVALAPPADAAMSLIGDDDRREPAFISVGVLASTVCMLILLVADW